jgi:hypothetical protein
MTRLSIVLLAALMFSAMYLVRCSTSRASS